MLNVLKYYLDASRQAMIHENQLSFDFHDHSIIFNYERFGLEDLDEDHLEHDFYSYNGINEVAELELLINKNIKFKTIELVGSEYLGWREDNNEIKRSITNEMYYFLNELSKERGVVAESYITSVDYGPGFCEDEGTYFFHIIIGNDFLWDMEFAKEVVRLIKNISIQTLDFYDYFFQKNSPIEDAKVLPILSTNTKVRRLGYYKLLSSFLKIEKKISAKSLNRKFEDYCIAHQLELENQVLNKGVIKKTATGISAKPYVDLALDVNILNKINNICSAGKGFKVYQILQEEYSTSNLIFNLNYFDKLFFLEVILRNDYFYISSLLKILLLNERVTYASLLNAYQPFLIKQIEDIEKTGKLLNRKTIEKLRLVLNRIKGWKKPEVYLEHLLMPRLNWLLELDLIIEDSQFFKMTNVGKRLFKHLAIWDDINTELVVTPDLFLDKFMIHVFDDCYNDSKGLILNNKNELLIKIYNYIDDSFRFFQTLAPNRVTASQAGNYVKYKLYFNDNIKVGYEFILNVLSRKEQNRFIFKYQKQYKDGYIQKK